MKTRVADVDEIPPGAMREATIEGKPIVVANVDDRLYAFQNACLHYGVRLSEGILEQETVTCRWHQWKYRIDTGEVLAEESEYETFTTFPVVVDGRHVLVIHEPKTRITRRQEAQ